MTSNTARQRRNRFQKAPLARQRVSREGQDFIILDYLETLDCARALTCWLLYKNGEHRQLVTLSCDPNLYESVETFRPAYAATKYLSKCTGLKTGIDLKEVAIKSAEEAELKNRLTNRYIVDIREGRASDLYGPEIFRAIQIIAGILGPCPETFNDPGWSTGRSSSSYGDLVTGYHKYQSSPDVTVRGRSRALRLLNGSPWWGASVLQTDAPASVLPRALPIIGGNTLITVPKSAKTDRVICYEPHMNIRLQLAVGDYLKHRLKRAGIDLRDQSVNRRRAEIASRDGSMATIDLSMASDTLSRELVWELLPIDWVCLLDDLRSHYTLWPDGQWRKCEKFSSMGNGFTFELESLVFYALSSAVTGNVSVYGDDIIIPTDSFKSVTRLLRACGFSLNDSKSYFLGNFRESCGGDYFCGVSCTPVYLRSLPKTVEDVTKLHNQVRRFAMTYPRSKWNELLRKWRTIYPGHLGPLGEFDDKYHSSNFFRDEDIERVGDGHYHVNWDECCPRAATSWCHASRRDLGIYTGLEGWIYRTRVPYMVPAKELGQYAPAICVATGPKRSFNLLSAAFKRQLKYKNIWGLARDWPNICWV